MKRNVTIIIFLAFFLILIISAITFLRREYISNIIEQRVVHIVENTIGRKIKFSDSHINIYPFYWQIRNVSVVDMNTGNTLLKAKDVRVYLRPGRLLSRTVFIKNIKFTESLTTVVRYPDGKTNLEGLFPKRPPTGWDVTINSIDILNGHILYNDQHKYKVITLKDVAGHVYPDLAKKRVSTDITATGDYNDRRISRHDLKVKGQFDVDIKERPIKTVTVKGLNIYSPEGSGISADGVIGLDGAIDLDSKIAASLRDISEDIRPKKDLQGKATFKGRIKGSFAIPDIEGNIIIDDLAYDGIRYGKLKGDLSLKENLFSLSNLKGKVLNGQIEGDIQIDNREGVPLYHVSLKSDSNQPYEVLTRYFPTFFKTLEKNGVISGEIEVSGTGFDFDKDMVVSKGWITYKDNVQKIRLSGGIDKGFNINIGMTGEVADIAKYLHIPHFPLHGLASLSGEITGTIEKPVISGIVMMPEGVVNGTVFDSVTADLRLSDGNLYLQPVVFRRGDGTYNFSGNIKFRSPGFKDPYFDLKAGITQGDPKAWVNIFYRELLIDMKVDGRMTFDGDVKDFSGSAEMKITRGSAYGQSFDSGFVAVTLTSHKVIFDRVSAELEGEDIDGKGWIGFRGEYLGEFHADINSKQFSIENINFLKKRASFITGAGTFSISGSGKISNPEIETSIQIPHLYLKGIDTGHAQLIAKKNREGEGGDEIKVQGQILDMHYAGNIAWNRDAPFTIAINLKESLIHPFLDLIKPGIAKDISINASGEIGIKGKLSDPTTLQADIILSQVTGIYSDYRIENDGDIRLSYTQNKLSFDAMRFKGEGTSLGIIGNLTPYGEANVFINGEADLRLLTLFTPEIKYSKGKAFLAFLLSGELKNPAIQGGLAIKDGTIGSATLKQTLEGADLSLFFNGREIVLESMHGNLGGGTINATGKVSIKEFVIKEFGFILEIANAIFRYPEGATTKIDGTLMFQGTPDSKGLKGEIQIRKALYEKNLNIRSLVLELQRKKVRVEQPVPFLGDTELNIHIVGKKDLWINNNIAKFPVEVDLLLKGTVDHPLVFGRIEAQDGTFVFSRNDFKVVSATADFISPDTIRPVLDIHATTEIRGYRINLKLSGTIDRFNLTLSSDPPLSETDILALLTIGQTATEVAETMAEVGAAEATAFLTAPIQEKIEEALVDIIKIDRFQVEPYYSNTTTSGGARLTVGKRLMDDKLYVTYTTGLTTVEELIKLEYFLGKNVYLVGERDEMGRMSGDIKFRLEFK